MNISVGEILKLENDKEYICIAVDKYKDANYLFLMSNFKPLEVMFAKEIINDGNINLEIVNDQQEKIELMERFKDAMPNQ